MSSQSRNVVRAGEDGFASDADVREGGAGTGGFVVAGTGDVHVLHLEGCCGLAVSIGDVVAVDEFGSIVDVGYFSR
jgi:hypothetical protein